MTDTVVQKIASTGAGIGTGLLAAVEVGDLNWWSIGIVVAVGGAAGFAAGFSRHVDDPSYTLLKVARDFFVGMLAAFTTFLLLAQWEFQTETKLAFSALMGWAGRSGLAWLTTRAKVMIR